MRGRAILPVAYALLGLVFGGISIRLVAESAWAWIPALMSMWVVGASVWWLVDIFIGRNRETASHYTTEK